MNVLQKENLGLPPMELAEKRPNASAQRVSVMGTISRKLVTIIGSTLCKMFCILCIVFIGAVILLKCLPQNDRAHSLKTNVIIYSNVQKSINVTKGTATKDDLEVLYEIRDSVANRSSVATKKSKRSLAKKKYHSENSVNDHVDNGRSRNIKIERGAKLPEADKDGKIRRKNVNKIKPFLAESKIEFENTEVFARKPRAAEYYGSILELDSGEDLEQQRYPGFRFQPFYAQSRSQNIYSTETNGKSEISPRDRPYLSAGTDFARNFRDSNMMFAPHMHQGECLIPQSSIQNKMQASGQLSSYDNQFRYKPYPFPTNPYYNPNYPPDVPYSQPGYFNQYNQGFYNSRMNQQTWPVTGQNDPGTAFEQVRHPQDVGLTMQHFGVMPTSSTSKAAVSTTHRTHSSARSFCPPDSRSCTSDDSCVDERQWCDGHVDCTDGSDEASCPCRARVGDRICDGYYDCPFGEDEMGCFGCEKDEFSCDDVDLNSKSSCFLKSQRCDGNVDCPNRKDEIECNMLAPSLHEKPIYAISHTEGFLHRNFKGKWYPVCQNPYMWAHDACVRETGLLFEPPVLQRRGIDPFFRGEFISNAHGGSFQLTTGCFNHSAVYVTCQDLMCGTRIQSTVQSLRENIEVENHMFGRLKRDMPQYPFGSQAYQNIHLPPIPGYPMYKRAARDYPNDMSYNYDQSGRVANKMKRAEIRVVGGQASLPGAWPWMVAIFKDGSFTCGGIVINKRWIVSAAHCVHNFWDHYYEVQVGMLRRTSFSPQEQNHRVTHVIVNQRYNRAEMSNDLSLLRVSPSIQFSRWVRPVCLPSPTTAGPEWMFAPPPGVTCTAVGWGATQEKPARAKGVPMDPDHMREVDVPIWDVCKHGEDIRGNEVCAGFLEGGKDACQGDSGGPLLCKNPLNAKQWYVAGIVSHGDGCGRKGEPGVYTRVSLFVEWIHFTLAAPHLPGLKPRQDCPGFKCVSGTTKCLPKERKCDRRVDCLDGEDEVNCAYENFGFDLLATTNNDNNETQLQPTNTEESTVFSEGKSVTENVPLRTSTEIFLLKNRTASHFHEDTKDLLPTPIPNPSSTESSDGFEIFTKIPQQNTNTTTANKSMNNENITVKHKTLDNIENVTRSPKVFIEEEDSKYINVSNEINKFGFDKTTTHDNIFTSTEIVPTETTNKTGTDIDKENKEINDDSSIITDRPKIDEIKKETQTPPTHFQTNEDSKELPISTTESITEKPESKGLPIDSTTHRSLPITTINPGHGKILPTHTIAEMKDKLITPPIFQCLRILQTIPYSYRCNHYADCEDGTDELECGCVDYITTFNRKLLCDGFADCPDASDEANCFVCKSEHFLCKWSHTCIPSKHVCDRTVHCPHAEDELDCGALTNGQYIVFDVDGRPEVNIEGYLTTRYPGGTWHVVCEDDIDIDDQEKAATNICLSMGFSGYREYKLKHVKMTDVIQRTIRNHDGTRQRIHFVHRTNDDDIEIGDEEEEEEKIIIDPVDVPQSCIDDDKKKTCHTLYVVCASVLNSEISSHRIMSEERSYKNSASEATNVTAVSKEKSDYIWPWASKVYVEGKYKCTGILVDFSWVLINHACLWDTIVNKDYVSVILGSKRSESPTSGPFEQIIEVDDKDDIYASKVTLLRLRNPAKLSRNVKPMVVPSSTLQRGDSAICVTVGRGANNRTETILLQEVHSDCGRNNRCFVRHNPTTACLDNDDNYGVPWAGIVACRAEQGGGWYPAASYVERDGMCGFRERLSAASLLTLRTDLNDSMAKKSVRDPDWEAPHCAGVRCGRGRCVPLLRTCDHVNDCEDGRDEDVEACESKQRYCSHDPFDAECSCNSGQIKCKNGVCVAKQLFGDGKDDCGDGSDEPPGATCAHYLARVAPHRLCDGKLHCLDRSDEDPNICKCFSKRHYECNRSDTCVATDLVCDGVHDCPHGEDESSCIGLVAETGTPYGTGEVIERRFGVWHTKCYRKANHTRSQLERICRDLGFIGGHARLLRSDPKPSVDPHTNVEVETFRNVTLNERTAFMLRSNDNPMARAVVDDTQQCYPVYIECK